MRRPLLALRAHLFERSDVIRGVGSTVVGLAALLASFPLPTTAQDPDEAPPIELSVDTASGALNVRLGTFLQSAGLEDALQSGLPLRVQVAVELWRDRFFDSQQGRSEWRASVLYEPLGRRYEVRAATSTRGTTPEVRSVSSLTAARLELQRSLSIPLRPESGGTYYYTAVLEVETLSLTDLEELQRWLQGDLAPAVSGDGDVGSAMGRGVRRMMIRMLGLPTRRFRGRTPAFPYEPPVGGGMGTSSGRERSPSDDESVDSPLVRMDPDPHAVWNRKLAIDQDELRGHQVAVPIAPTLRKISWKGEPGQGRERHVVRAPNARLEHASDPGRHAPLATKIMDGHGVCEASDSTWLDTHDAARAEVQGECHVVQGSDRLVQADRRLQGLLQFRVIPEVVPGQRLFEHEEAEAVQLP